MRNQVEVTDYPGSAMATARPWATAYIFALAGPVVFLFMGLVFALRRWPTEHGHRISKAAPK